MADELVGEGGRGTSDRSRGEIKGDERGRPVGRRGIWQSIRFVSRTEGGNRDDVNLMPDLYSWTSSLSCVAVSEAWLWPKCSPCIFKCRP